MSTSYIQNIEHEIRLIVNSIAEPHDPSDWKLSCSIDGTCSGIPAAFCDALVRKHTDSCSSKRLHSLLPELAFAVSRETKSLVKEVAILGSEGKITFEYH